MIVVLSKSSIKYKIFLKVKSKNGEVKGFITVFRITPNNFPLGTVLVTCTEQNSGDTVSIGTFAKSIYEEIETLWTVNLFISCGTYLWFLLLSNVKQVE